MASGAPRSHITGIFSTDKVINELAMYWRLSVVFLPEPLVQGNKADNNRCRVYHLPRIPDGYRVKSLKTEINYS